jgi:hypothetical protein
VEAHASTLRPGETELDGGKRHWFVPDAFLPGESSHGVESHESACLLNCGDHDARVRFTFFFADRDPLGPVEVVLEARRGRHVRLDDRSAIGVDLPRGVPYAYAVESDVPVVLQHSRLDTSAGGYTLFTTIAYGE